MDQMAVQSKIKYTVVEDSPYYEYFENMAYAEQVMYEAWKDIVLATAPNDTRYLCVHVPYLLQSMAKSPSLSIN